MRSPSFVCFIYLDLLIIPCLGECHRFNRTGANRFRTTREEFTGGGRFVRRTGLTVLSIIRQLISHLKPTVRTDLSLLHQVGSITVVVKQDTVQILDEFRRVLFCRTNRLLNLTRHFPSQWFGWGQVDWSRLGLNRLTVLC